MLIILFKRLNNMNKTVDITKDKINNIKKKTDELEETKNEIEQTANSWAGLLLFLSIRKLFKTIKELRKEKSKKVIIKKALKTTLSSANKIRKVI